jgi:uncharacterized protein YhaN
LSAEQQDHKDHKEIKDLLDPQVLQDHKAFRVQQAQEATYI